MKNTYYVTFHYTTEIKATDRWEADSLAWEDFAEHFGSLSPGDFVSSEPEQQWWTDEEPVK